MSSRGWVGARSRGKRPVAPRHMRCSARDMDGDMDGDMGRDMTRTTARDRTHDGTWLVVAGSILVGCVGDIGAVAGAAPGTEGTAEDALCADGTVDVAESPLRRLTRREYNNAVRDLLGDDSRPADDLVPDESISGFASNSVAPVTKLQVEDYVTVAESLAAKAVADNLPALITCDLSDESCVAEFVARFGRRAFRRPVDAALADGLLDIYRTGASSWGATKGFELLLQTMLASPHFLYHVELPAEGAEQVAPVDGYALAARLAFFFWQSVPDDELLDAAEAGELDSAEGVASQARRLIEDQRSTQMVESFFGQWLMMGMSQSFDDIDEQLKDPTLFPEWGPELGAAMRRETMAFAEHVVRDGESLETLLTASYTFGDAEVAALYGAQPAADGFGRIELDPGERAGLLTHASLLAARAHASENSWVHRGKFVREALLCDPIPPPPPGVNMNTANDPNRLTNPECMGCHRRMDPIGLGFEQYDAIGAFDDGASASGELIDAGDLSGTFASPVDLASRLAASDVVRRCLAKYVFRFAAHRAETEQDACSLETADAAFVESGTTLSELFVSIGQSDAFRYRRTTP